MREIETAKVWSAGFKTSVEATNLNKEFLGRLGFSSYYQPARLALEPLNLIRVIS